MKKTILAVTIIILLLFILSLSQKLQNESTQTNHIPTVDYWIPQIGDSFQWQLADYPIDTSINADIYDVDLFETSQETIEKLHSENKKIICYINVGAYEEYRDDTHLFPKEVIGNEYEGWEDENWLDISNYKLFSDILEKRFDLAKEKGCDGIEPDNIEGYQENTGFNISYRDQLEFNIWLAEQVHKRGMSIGLKNNPDQIDDLLEYYDWALLEDCYEWNFCKEFELFTNTGKAVFQVEYTDNDITLDDFCSQSTKNKFIGILKNRELDSWIQSCTKI